MGRIAVDNNDNVFKLPLMSWTFISLRAISTTSLFLCSNIPKTLKTRDFSYKNTIWWDN